MNAGVLHEYAYCVSSHREQNMDRRFFNGPGCNSVEGEGAILAGGFLLFEGVPNEVSFDWYRQ